MEHQETIFVDLDLGSIVKLLCSNAKRGLAACYSEGSDSLPDTCMLADNNAHKLVGSSIRYAIISQIGIAEWLKTHPEDKEYLPNPCPKIADNHHKITHIGDSDDGKAVVLSETDRNIVQSMLATSAVLFKRGDFKAKAGRFDETSFWLLGNEGREKFNALSAEPGVNRKAFEQGGYYILSGSKETKVKAIFDCGPLGFGPISAHGHADSLSFVLDVHGLPFFIDPETYTYQANNPFREYFRSTAAHNTVVVDGQDQSQMAGPFLWGNKANSYLEEYKSEPVFDRVIGRHHGYTRLEDPVVHRRSIEVNKEQDIVEITDTLEAAATHNIAIYFHLSPQCSVKILDTNRWYITNGNKKVELITDARLDSEIISGSENPLMGWASKGYDYKQPTNTLICKGSFTGRQSFITRIKL